MRYKQLRIKQSNIETDQDRIEEIIQDSGIPDDAIQTYIDF